eukprot:g1800.t1
MAEAVKAKVMGCVNGIKAKLGIGQAAPVQEMNGVVTDDGNDAFIVEAEDDEHDDDEMFQHEEEDEEEEFLLEDTGNGEGFMAVKPWIGAMVTPSEYEDAFIPTEQPSEELKLSWVFGYTKEGRNNAFELPSGEIVWPSGAVGVVYNPSNHTQRFLQGHTDTIYAVAQSPTNKSIVATGGKQHKRKAETPMVIVWNAETGEQLATLRNPKVKRGILALEFSPDGRYIVAVGGSDVHNVCVYDWQSGSTKSMVEAGREVVLDAYFSEKSLITVGAKHFMTYPFNNGTVSKGKKNRSVRTNVYSVCSDGKNMWAGVSGGKILVFSGSSLRKEKKGVHKGNVLALASNGSGTIVSGGSDGKMNVFNGTDIANTFQISKHAVSSLSFCANGSRVVAGTRRGEVFLVDTSTGDKTVCVESHFDGETWGLAVHPFDPYVVTSGDDNTLIYWDMNTKKVARRKELVDGSKKAKRTKKRPPRGGASTTGRHPQNQCSRAVSFDPMAEMLAVGMNDGSFIVLEEKTLDQIVHKRGKHVEQWVQDLKFCPLDPVLAVSTHDNWIDLWGYEGREFSHLHRLKGHNSFITHIDWTSDGESLQSNCGAYELLFWDPKTGKQVTSATSLKDAEWDTWSCVLGWPVKGIWDTCAKGSDVNCVSRSVDKTLLVTGENSQKLKLFKYPVADNAEFKAYSAHGSFVTNARFSANDDFIATVGGNDNALMIWTIEK